MSLLIIPIAIGTFLTTYGFIKNVDPDTYIAQDTIYKNVVEADGGINVNVNYALQRTCTVVIGMIPSGMLLLTRKK